MDKNESLWPTDDAERSGRGLGVTSGTFYGNLQRYLKSARLPASGVHILRHSAAKLLRDAGESVEDVSRFMDHSSIAVPATYLRRLEGQEDLSWQRVAGRWACKLFPRGMTTDSAPPDISERLLTLLRRATGEPLLQYSQTPEQILGGYDTRIFAFQLVNAPPPWSDPLILRLFAEDDDPLRARLEGAVQTSVAGMGYPAPRVLLGNVDPAALGAGFIVMKRLPGRPMLQAATLAGMLSQATRLVSSYPRVLADYQARLHALDAESLVRALEAADLEGSRPGEAGVSRRSATLDGQLAQLSDRIDRRSLDGLRPGFQWLVNKRPNDPERPVICHGDFHPINVLVENGTVTGVIDWAMAVVADPAFDVANTRLLLAIAPLELPAALDALADLVRHVVVRRYYRAYLEHRSVDANNVRYFEGLRCLMELGWVGERRAQGAGMYRNPWGAPRSVRKLVSHFRLATGITPALAPV